MTFNRLINQSLVRIPYSIEREIRVFSTQKMAMATLHKLVELTVKAYYEPMYVIIMQLITPL